MLNVQGAPIKSVNGDIMLDPFGGATSKDLDVDTALYNVCIQIRCCMSNMNFRVQWLKPV